MVRQSFPNAMCRPKDEIKAEAKVKQNWKRRNAVEGFKSGVVKVSLLRC